MPAAEVYAMLGITGEIIVRQYPFFLVAVAGFNLAACDSIGSLSETRDELKSQKVELSALRDELDRLRSEIASIKQQQSSLAFNNMLRDFEKVAYLEPGDAGYSPIHFDIGVLTIQMADIKAYANGSKINLKIGNPLSSSINGLKAKLQWGRVNDEGGPINETAKSKDFTFTETLRSGAWTTIPVVLDGIPPAELGFVRVSEVTHTGISLIR